MDQRPDKVVKIVTETLDVFLLYTYTGQFGKSEKDSVRLWEWSTPDPDVRALRKVHSTLIFPTSRKPKMIFEPAVCCRSNNASVLVNPGWDHSGHRPTKYQKRDRSMFSLFLVINYKSCYQGMHDFRIGWVVGSDISIYTK